MNFPIIQVKTYHCASRLVLPSPLFSGSFRALPVLHPWISWISPWIHSSTLSSPWIPFSTPHLPLDPLQHHTTLHSYPNPRCSRSADCPVFWADRDADRAAGENTKHCPTMSTTGPCTTGPSTTGPSTTGPSTTGTRTTGPSTTGRSTTGPSTTGPWTPPRTKQESQGIRAYPGALFASCCSLQI